MWRFVFVLVVVSMLGFGSPGLAGDYFFGCAQPGGGYVVEEGENKLEIFHSKPGSPNEKDGAALDYKLVQQITVRESEGYCLAENGTKYGWSSHTYLYQIEVPSDDEAPIELTFLCETSGSGLPAAINTCKNVTTKDKRLQPAYKDLVTR